MHNVSDPSPPLPSVATMLLSVTPANISVMNRRKVSTDPEKGTCNLEEIEPSRSGVYVARSSALTILDVKLCVTRTPCTFSPTVGSDSFTARVPMTLAARRRANFNDTVCRFGGIVMVGLLF
jgi:hypothetical protein